MSTSERANPPETPYRVPLVAFSTPQWGLSTPGPCHTPYPYTVSTPQGYSTPVAPPETSKSKKRALGKENAPLASAKKRKVTPEAAQFSDLEKVQMFFAFLEDVLQWDFGEMFYKASLEIKELAKEHKDVLPLAQPLSPSAVKLPSPWTTRLAPKTKLTTIMTHFFNGRGQYTPAMILQQWSRHAYGAKHRDSELMYSTTIDFIKIKPVRPALTSFAAQTIRDKLASEANEATAPSNGLHVSISTKKTATRAVQWTDIGSTTVERTQSIIKKHQPVTWKLLVELASRAPRKENGVNVVRQKRPPELVATGIISTLNFSRTSRAKLLPLATGILYFGSLASTDLYRFRSRMGEMPAYSSVIRAMRALSTHEAAVTLAHGQSPSTLGVIRLDNVQNYLFQRDQAIGRENKLNIGLAATYYEVNISESDLSLFDLPRKKAALLKGRRKEMTVAQLQGMLDNRHIETVCILQWMNTLIQHIPQLGHLKSEIALLYKTRAAKIRIPPSPSKVHPLASSSRNEVIFTDLKDALNDFFAQTGQTSEEFKKRLFPVGGDGLTYEKMVQLKEYLQFHENKQESFEILQPLLEWWHTEWTNLSRIFECFWGPLLSKDPSTLGNSADKIGRKKPTNLKKVDYYACVELAYLVLDVRILDIWRIHYNADDLFDKFNILATQNKLPSMEDLQNSARELYRAYTSVRAQERAMMGDAMVPNFVPRGQAQESYWAPLDKGKKQDKLSTAVPAHGPQFFGDQVLTRSIAFIRETMLAREMTLATAEGDVGRIWEVIKTMLFTFAGSSHTKYTNYLLEMIADLELESEPKLRDALLQMSLVNLSGQEGRFAAGDFIQEFFNRLLEAIVQRKGVEYGDRFIRNVWSRNVHHIGRLKLAWLDGIGLKRHSAKHTGAKQNAEVRILLQHYKESELHSLLPGRKHDEEPFVDDFQKGLRSLRGGKLKKWIIKTTRSRRLMDLDIGGDTRDLNELDSDSDDEEDSTIDISADAASANKRENLRFSVVTHDGNLQLNPLDLEDNVDEIIQMTSLDMEANLLDDSDDDN